MSFMDYLAYYVLGIFVLIAFSAGVLGGFFASWLDGKIYMRKLKKGKMYEKRNK